MVGTTQELMKALNRANELADSHSNEYNARYREALARVGLVLHELQPPPGPEGNWVYAPLSSWGPGGWPKESWIDEADLIGDWE